MGCSDDERNPDYYYYFGDYESFEIEDSHGFLSYGDQVVDDEWLISTLDLPNANPPIGDQTFHTLVVESLPMSYEALKSKNVKFSGTAKFLYAVKTSKNGFARFYYSLELKNMVEDTRSCSMEKE